MSPSYYFVNYPVARAQGVLAFPLIYPGAISPDDKEAGK